MATFKIGINMAGAISAGAYTAGVLDFLTEALDGWYKAKKNGEAVPMHDVSIEVFSGASAGGMCAAISSVMMQQDFEHIHDTGRRKEKTTNIFFESWVNTIDIRRLLETEDLKDKNSPVVSLLDSTVIKDIAGDVLVPKNLMAEPRPYIAKDMTLILSLTNLRGTPYSLDDAAPGSVEESALFHGDHMQFKTVRAQSGSLKGSMSGAVRTLNLATAGEAGGWDVLQTAAMATGAFPIFLAPRILKRSKIDYTPAPWLEVTSGEPKPIPAFPADMEEPFDTLIVDGGVTNNDPFNFAHDFLLNLEPKPTGDHNPRGPMEANRAVITVAPFPTIDLFKAKYDAKASSSVFVALPKLFSALISQSRFFGESLDNIMGGTTFSRFIIAPSDNQLTEEYTARGVELSEQPPALQCAALGAFGGFFEREFRAHDYALGRRNCQKFLMESFVLPKTNPIIAEGLTKLPVVPKEFVKSAPGTYGMSAEQLKAAGMPLPPDQEKAGPVWIPIIPLCTEALRTEVPRPKRAKLKHKDLEEIVALIMKRFKALSSRFIDDAPARLRWFLRPGPFFIGLLGRKPLTDALIKQLGDSYEPER